jgi:hypothetical protein
MNMDALSDGSAKAPEARNASGRTDVDQTWPRSAWKANRTAYDLMLRSRLTDGALTWD